jgi:hypothetical protein
METWKSLRFVKNARSDLSQRVKIQGLLGFAQGAKKHRQIFYG